MFIYTFDFGFEVSRYNDYWKDEEDQEKSE